MTNQKQTNNNIKVIKKMAQKKKTQKKKKTGEFEKLYK